MSDSKSSGFHKQLISNLVAQCLDFAKWWMETLLSLVPEPVSAAFQDERSSVYIRNESGEYTVMSGNADKMLLSENTHGPKHACLLLDRNSAIIRIRTYPKVSPKRLKEITRLQLLSDSPFDPGEISFDLRVLSENHQKKEVLVEIAMLKNAVIEQHRDALAEQGVVLDGVDILDGTGRASGFNFIPEEQLARFISVMPVLNRVSLATAIVLLVSIPLIYSWSLDRIAEQYASDVDALRRESGGIVELRKSTTAAVRALRTFERKRSSETRFALVYEELARVLPDDAWLDAIEYTEQDIQLTILARDPSALIGILEQSDSFESASYISSVIKDARYDVDRLRLKIVLRQSVSTDNRDDGGQR